MYSYTNICFFFFSALHFLSPPCSSQHAPEFSKRKAAPPLLPVNEPPADAALEEAAAAVAGVDAVVFAAAGVAAHLAHQRRAQGLPRRRALGCGFKHSAGGREGRGGGQEGSTVSG